MARHINRLDITTFRGIHELHISELGDINIITGDNNSGKTSLLELISSFAAPSSLVTWLRLGRSGQSRSLTSFERFDLLFDVDAVDKKVQYDLCYKGKDYKIVLNAELGQQELADKQIQQLSLFSLDEEERGQDKPEQWEMVNLYNAKVSENGEITEFPAIYENPMLNFLIKSRENIRNIIYVAPTDHVKSELYLSNVLNEPELYEEMLAVLKEFDEGIISINADKMDSQRRNQSVVYKILSKQHGKAIPLNMYGDGMKKAVLLMSAVIKAKNGILLLDEFETAIHTSAMGKVFRWILNACMKLNVQVFMTSHSDEAILKVLECEENLKDNIKQITLYKNGDVMVARELTASKAIALRRKGVELR